MALAEVRSICIYRRSLAYDMPFQITTAAFNHLLPSSYTDTLLSAIVSLAALTAAAPSPGFSKKQEAHTGPIPSQQTVACDDDPNRTYCFDEVVWGRGMSTSCWKCSADSF
ncbi:hypothetical protein IG631_07796 [Alternaria alternata]|nr:hypothetical protein IG631_07796 [Alternaria alternata]